MHACCLCLLCAGCLLQYVVLLAASQEALVKDSATKVLWCGWHNILTDPNVCQFQLSTLRQTWFAVKPTQAGLLTLGEHPDRGYVCMCVCLQASMSTPHQVVRTGQQLRHCIAAFTVWLAFQFLQSST